MATTNTQHGTFLDSEEPTKYLAHGTRASEPPATKEKEEKSMTTTTIATGKVDDAKHDTSFDECTRLDDSLLDAQSIGNHFSNTSIWKWFDDAKSYRLNLERDKQNPQCKINARDGAVGVAVLGVPVHVGQVIEVVFQVKCVAAQIGGSDLTLRRLFNLLLGAATLLELKTMDLSKPMRKRRAGYTTCVDELRFASIGDLRAMLTHTMRMTPKQFVYHTFTNIDGRGLTKEEYKGLQMRDSITCSVIINRRYDYMETNFGNVGTPTLTDLNSETAAPFYFCFYLESERDNCDTVTIDRVVVHSQTQ